MMTIKFPLYNPEKVEYIIKKSYKVNFSDKSRRYIIAITPRKIAPRSGMTEGREFLVYHKRTSYPAKLSFGIEEEPPSWIQYRDLNFKRRRMNT